MRSKSRTKKRSYTSKPTNPVSANCGELHNDLGTHMSAIHSLGGPTFAACRRWAQLRTKLLLLTLDQAPGRASGKNYRDCMESAGPSAQARYMTLMTRRKEQGKNMTAIARELLGALSGPLG